MADKKKTKSKAGEVHLKNVRLAFEHIWEAQASVEGGKKKFSGNFLMDPETSSGKKNIKACQAAVDAVMEEEWGTTDVKIKEGRLSFVDGDDCVNESGDVYSGFEGMKVVKANNARRVAVFDRDGETPLTEEDNKIYSGAIVNAIVRFYTVKGKAKGGNGVFASLEGVQFVKDGERFGGGSSVTAGTFSDLGDDEDEEDEDDLPKSKKSKRVDDDEDDEDEAPAKKKKKKSRVVEDDDEDEDEDERPAKKKKKKSRVVEDDEDDEDEEI